MNDASPQTQVLLLSPYHGGSHAAWGDGYARHGRLPTTLLTLPARFWKWRMHGAAVTLARRFNAAAYTPGVILATDMLDLATFLALTRRRTAAVPAVLYMHENQLTYPLPADGATGPMRRQLGERDRHYAFINFSSMLVADQVWFNSAYHRQSFFAALPAFLRHFPEYRELGSVDGLRRKSHVVPVGIDFERLENGRVPHTPGHPPLILWNQRWEYDKNPEEFFAALATLHREGIPFDVALCGQQYGQQPPAFAEGLDLLGSRIVHSGYAAPALYARLLWQADIVISTAQHEFFGISILEAIHAETFPLLPNRLSYPELLPPRFHSDCLYADQADLVQKLRRRLLDPQGARQAAAALAPATARYAWPALAPQYDQRLADLVDSVT